MCVSTIEKHGATPANIQWTVVRGDNANLLIEFFEDDEETAYEIKEKAEQYYNEYGTLEDALRKFENEDEKEFARQHLTDAYGL